MKNISSVEYKQMLLYGAEVLKNRMEVINALNVFPVPDGDTGTNMNMTMQSGVKPLKEKEFNNVGELSKSVSKGMLLGARGNSGVILSQFFRGLAEGLDGVDEIDKDTFVNALKQGKIRAYSSVIKAVEGTILTVINDMSEFDSNSDDFNEYFNELIIEGQRSLDNTPNLLPVLKEVGVVDSGGAGLLDIFKGMQMAVNGEELVLDENADFETFMQTEEHPLNIDDIVYGYCTEMLIRLNTDVDINDVREKLEGFGDSIVAVCDEDILKTHVHTETPVDVFSYGSSLGDFIHVKSENMRIQAEEASGNREEKENGIVTVAPSKEMAELFTSISDVEIIMGGQTLNPSTEDIVKAIKATNAKNVIVLPNNSNIIMAAEAAVSLLENVNVKVVKTKHMTQGLECLMNYDQTLDIEENLSTFENVIENTLNYEITTAIKDTQINGVCINKDDFLVLKQGSIIASVKEEKEAIDFIKNDLDLDEIEIITTLLGEGSNEKLLKNLEKEIEKEYPFLEVINHKTQQSIYPYLIVAVKE